MSELKRLPRRDNGEFEREFTANGRRYIILSQEEGIGIKRFSSLQYMSATVFFNMDAGTLFQNLNKMRLMLDQLVRDKTFSLGTIYAHLQGMLDGIKSINEREYMFTFWSCCLFIIHEDEDRTKWVEAEQKRKLDDWQAAGIHEADFDELLKKKLVEFSQPSNGNKTAQENGVPRSSEATA